MAERGARGGRRAGKPGAKYPQRADLALAPRTAPVVPIGGQTYGSQTAQVQGARAVNDAGAQAATRAVAPPAPTSAPPTQPPNIMQRLTAPSARPDEPFQAGLPTGPGAGPEAMGLAPAPSPNDELIDNLRAAWQAFPHPDLLDLLQFEEERRG